MKKLKYLLLAVFMSCAFVLGACGDGQLGVEAEANIGNPENYEAATTEEKAELTDYVAEETAGDEVDAFRMTLEMDMFGVTMYYNAIIAEVDGEPQMAIKMTTTVGDYKVTVKMYLVDNVLAMDAGNASAGVNMQESKVKVEIPTDVLLEEVPDLTTLLSYDLDYIMQIVKSINLEAEGTNLRVNVEDTTKRFEITQNTGTETSTIYVVFENDVLQSIQMNANEMKLVISSFDGEIEFPDFSSFKEYSYEDLISGAE